MTSKWIWLDARYTPAECARLCRTTLGSVVFAMEEGRLVAGADGLVRGLALFCWLVSSRISGRFGRDI